MKFDFILIIGIVMNLMLSMTFPQVILGDNAPFKLQGVEKDFTNTGYQDENIKSQLGNSTLTEKDTKKIAESTNLGEDNEQYANPFSDTGGTGFIDWISVGIDYIKQALLFVVPFISIIYLLPMPLSFFLGTIFTLLYIYTLAKLIMGR